MITANGRVDRDFLKSTSRITASKAQQRGRSTEIKMTSKDLRVLDLDQNVRLQERILFAWRPVSTGTQDMRRR